MGVARSLCAPQAGLVSLGIYAKHRLSFRLKGFQNRCPCEGRMCAYQAHALSGSLAMRSVQRCMARSSTRIRRSAGHTTPSPNGWLWQGRMESWHSPSATCPPAEPRRASGRVPANSNHHVTNAYIALARVRGVLLRSRPEVSWRCCQQEPILGLVGAVLRRHFV